MNTLPRSSKAYEIADNDNDEESDERDDVLDPSSIYLNDDQNSLMFMKSHKNSGGAGK